MKSENSDLNTNQLQVKIHSPSKTYYDDVAKVVSATNESGPFDILPQHHSFIALLSAGKVGVVDQKGSTHEFEIDGGLIRVRDNNVTIFIGF